ncbi:MAG: hypothetical protein ABIU97_11090, partial [Dehalococcoidia bacterium]
LNALFGERYKQVTKETRAVVLGQYGKTPAPISKEVLAKVAPDGEPITGRPADTLDPELDKTREEIGALARSDEDLLSYVLFPPVAREFFEWREKGSGVEDELVAAIAVALSQGQPGAAPGGNGTAHGHDHDPWKMAGRRRALRA